MPQIGLVAHQHDDDVGIGVIAQLPQPPFHVLVGQMLGDVVDQERPNGAAVIGRRDGSVPLLARRVPDLGLDGLAVDLDAARGEFHADRRLGFEVEFVARESAQQITLANAGIADQHH